MKLFDHVKPFFSSLLLLVILNLIIKPLWVFGIDRQVQNVTGLEAYGNYFALLNLCMMMQFLLDLGITPYFNRKFSAEPNNVEMLASQAFTIKLLLSLLFTLVVMLVAFFTGVANWSLLGMLMVMQVLTTFLLLFRAYLSGAQQFNQDAWLSVTDKIFVIVATGWLLLWPGMSGGVTINRFVMIQIGGMVLSVGLAIFFLYRHRKDILMVRLNIDSGIILKSSLPFALNIFFMTALFRADGFMVERLVENGDYHAGVYASAFRLTDAVNMMGFLVAGFLLPYISRNWQNKAASELVLRVCLYFLLVPAIVIATAGWFLADEINNLLYHARAPEASVVIRILLLCLPALAVIQVYGTHLTATGHIKTFLGISAFFALLNISLNVFIIPAFGNEGAAWTAVATQSLFAAGVAYIAARKTKIRLPMTDAFLYLTLLLISILIFKWLIL